MIKFLSALLLVSALQSKAQEKPEGLFINSKAPDFKGKDQNGNEIALKDLRKKGPVVVIFYRGYWCPYCNKELQKLEDSLPLIKEKGAQLVAITPEKQEGIAKTIEKTKASYPIVTDDELKIMRAYDVAYQVDTKTIDRYKMASIDLAANNGQKPDAAGRFRHPSPQPLQGNSSTGWQRCRPPCRKGPHSEDTDLSVANETAYAAR